MRDVFETFLPEDQRVKRLGDTIKPAELLKLAGNIEQGKQLFHKTAGVACRNCHRIAGDGTELGPDLSQIGKKYDRTKLLESILEPSKNIDPQFVTWVIETVSGKVITGLLVRKDDTEIIVKDAQNKQHRFVMSEVEGAHPQQKSLMPRTALAGFPRPSRWPTSWHIWSRSSEATFAPETRSEGRHRSTQPGLPMERKYLDRNIDDRKMTESKRIEPQRHRVHRDKK